MLSVLSIIRQIQQQPQYFSILHQCFSSNVANIHGIHEMFHQTEGGTPLGTLKID